MEQGPAGKLRESRLQEAGKSHLLSFSINLKKQRGEESSLMPRRSAYLSPPAAKGGFITGFLPPLRFLFNTPSSCQLEPPTPSERSITSHRPPPKRPFEALAHSSQPPLNLASEIGAHARATADGQRRLPVTPGTRPPDPPNSYVPPFVPLSKSPPPGAFLPTSPHPCNDPCSPGRHFLSDLVPMSQDTSARQECVLLAMTFFATGLFV